MPVWLSYRDPAFFENDRPKSGGQKVNKNLVFKLITHFCIGAALARLEGQIDFRVLFKRLPNLRLHPTGVTAPYGHDLDQRQRLLQWG